MDTHPIPQNVTSFQFKLVGDMTLKQFLYLATGAGFAYLLLVVFSRNYPLVWILIALSAILGVSFAFLPIESRPLDHWFAAFIKAIYSPTKRTWSKNGKTYQEDPLFNSRLVMYLTAAQPQQLSTDYRLLTPATLSASPSAILAEVERPKTEIVSSLPTQEELKKTVDLARQAQKVQMKIMETERNLTQIKMATQKPTPILVDYSQQVNKIITDLQSLVRQASIIKQQLQSIHPPEVKTENIVIPTVPKEKIKVVIPAQSKQTQIALTTFPNVINGITKDKAGNYLEGAVTVIYDKEGLPVRALKTNKLGQFSGSTPLPSETYTLELEKDGYSFDILQIELTGTVLPPLIITAK